MGTAFSVSPRGGCRSPDPAGDRRRTTQPVLVEIPSSGAKSPPGRCGLFGPRPMGASWLGSLALQSARACLNPPSPCNSEPRPPKPKVQR
eukprot:9249812-Pyramimonas_sp.AAC.1